MATSKHVLILGMRRSGTSLTAGLLARLGYYLENNSRPPDQHNPEGYWESKRVQDLNTRLLSRLGGSEDRPPRTPKGWELRPEFKGERKKAESIAKSYRSHEPWGMKDDRLSLTLPLWKLVLPSDVSYIICVRNPLAVVRSITRMERSHDWQLAFMSWYSHVGNAILNTQGERRMLVFYEDFQEDPQAQSSRLCEFLERESVPKLWSVFKSELSHQQPSVKDFLDTKQAPAETKHLYLALLQTRSGASDLDYVSKSLKGLAF